MTETEINLLSNMTKSYLHKQAQWIQPPLQTPQQPALRLLAQRQKLKIQVPMMKWPQNRKAYAKWRKATYFQFLHRPFSFTSAWCYLQFIIFDQSNYLFLKMCGAIREKIKTAIVRYWATILTLYAVLPWGFLVSSCPKNSPGFYQSVRSIT